jgi:hypothetical protein
MPPRSVVKEGRFWFRRAGKRGREWRRSLVAWGEELEEEMLVPIGGEASSLYTADPVLRCRWWSRRDGPEEEEEAVGGGRGDILTSPPPLLVRRRGSVHDVERVAWSM